MKKTEEDFTPCNGCDSDYNGCPGLFLCQKEAGEIILASGAPDRERVDQRKMFELSAGQIGIHQVIDYLIEECAELIVSLQHYKRERVPLQSVLAEISDVQVMCSQFRVNQDKDSEQFNVIHKAKLLRLKSRVLQRLKVKDNETNV